MPRSGSGRVCLGHALAVGSWYRVSRQGPEQKGFTVLFAVLYLAPELHGFTR